MSGNNGNNSRREGIAIIGLGCVYPKAHTIDQYWNNILNKVSGIKEIPKNRWDYHLYYDADKNVPDKTYSKIGGFVDDIDMTDIIKKYKLPPKIVNVMDRAQKYALVSAHIALADAGYAEKEFDRSRTAVIIGNSMGGDMIDYTNYRVFMSDVGDHLKKGEAFKRLDPASQKLIMDELQKNVKSRLPEVTEDSMPGELSNVIAGRIANVMNLTGPNFSVDAACASSMASIREAVKGLRNHDFDLVVAGGTDYMMGPGPYVKFCKIGALSPDGSYPFDVRANGFVMGEGTGIFILKRVIDARRDGNKIYAIIRGVGASSDGRGKGITAPNPKGQMLAIERAFEDAGYSSDTVQYVEAHGTATIVGDGAELESLLGVWDKGVKNSSVGLGSIKSNIGHLKAAAGSAAIIKTALALHHKIMPPSINYEKPNPNVKFGSIPFRVITNSEPWPEGINGNPRRANASAFGFGGTNFHIALEEDTGTNGMPEERKYYPGASVAEGAGSMQIMKDSAASAPVCDYSHPRYKLSNENKAKQGGEAVVIGASSWNEIRSILDNLKSELSANPKLTLKDIGLRFNMASNSKDVRLGISAYTIEDFVDKFDSAKEGIDNLKRRMVLKNRGLFFGDNLLAKKKTLSKVGVLFPGQGNQYVNMLKDLYNKFKVVKETFDEADRVMYDIIGRGITEIIFLPDDASKEEFDKSENQLKQTEFTQPGVLTADYAMFRLLMSFGIKPDVAVGHSLGEYGALIAAGVMSFKDALFAVSARGREIASVKIDDVGKMLSVPAPVAKTEALLKGIGGYAIIANKNCHSQTVVAGDTPSVLKVKERCEAEGIPAQLIPVSHAFHSQIVAPACPSYRRVIESFKLQSPKIDIIANLTGDYYPKGDNVRQQIVDILVNHIANPVEFIKQIDRMYADGVNVFVEAGPKRTLTSFIVSILEGKEYLAMATNHPKKGGIGTLNDALVAMSTEGFDINWNGVDEEGSMKDHPDWRLLDGFPGKKEEIRITAPSVPRKEIAVKERKGDLSTDAIYGEFQKKQKDLLNEILDIYSKKSAELLDDSLSDALYYKKEMEKYNINLEKVVISGVAIGLPGKRFSVFGDDVFDRIIAGENMIDPLTDEEMGLQLNKNITRLMKSPDGEASFHKISSKSEVVKLAARKGKFDFEDEYGIKKEFSDRLDITTKLSIAAGIEALKDAGIPLVMNYITTSTGKLLPTTWGLSEEMQDDTGIIFCSAFPGHNALIEEVSKEVAYKYGRKSKQELIKLYTSIIDKVNDQKLKEDLTGWFTENYSILKDIREDNVYEFNRKFLFRILAMGHSQFAEFIKAKGPNIHINVACSSTTAAVGISQDWIRMGRCKRVIVVGGDDVTSSDFLEWIMSGFLAVGAVSVKADVKEAAIPFDRRRNGMLVGMGAVGIIVEAESEIKKRGMEPIGEVIAVEFLNSAFHGTRLDVNHISAVMERLIKNVEKRTGVKRDELAKHTVFMSHETYTPARGGSASAEAESLRKTFGPDYKSVVVANTKGFTGHSMAVGVEDAVVLKVLQRGMVPPIANHKEIDPELGDLNLSRGGEYKDLQYALRLGAGFGSQIAMSFIKLVSKKENRIVEQTAYNKWLKEISYIENPEVEIVKRMLRVKKDGKLLKTVEDAPVRAASVPVVKPGIAAVQAQSAVGAAVSAPGLAEKGPLDDIKKKIMKIVGEKTGYAEDLIEFDLDMESDLGIDTVKQAEMFGMIRETFNISKEENIKIKDFPTLNHVINFVKTKSPQFKGVDFSAAAAGLTVAAPQPVVQAAAAKPAGKGPLDDIKKKILKIVGEKTGYSEDLIEFDLDMESDLGIDTVKQAEMFGMIRETFEISKEESIRIKDFPTLNHVVEFVRAKSPQKFASVEAPVSAPKAVVTAPHIGATVTVPATVPAPSPSTGGGLDEIRRRIVKIVEEKTGYSEDLIEFDLDMESDLGIDTVKQAEMFGMIRETFDIAKEESIRIKDFPTLNHVIEFVETKSPQFKNVEAAVSAPPVAVSAAQPAVKPAAGATVTVPATVPAPRAAGGGLDEIRKKIVKIVEEKTGYSEDLIEFDLDMESDLGIDTVKQAEMFGMIRETFNIAKEESIRIKDFPTLNHVIEFVRTKSPQFKNVEAAVSAPRAAVSAPRTASGDGMDEIKKKIIKIVEEKTGYSEDLIEFDLDMESDLGIDTVKQAEMFGMIRETFNIAKEESIRIKDFPTLNHVIEFVRTKSPQYMIVEAAVSAPQASVQPVAVIKESRIKRMTLEMVEEAIDKKAQPKFNMKGLNILITDDGRGVAGAMEKLLTEEGAKVVIIKQAGMEKTESLIIELERVKKTGKINGIIHLTPLEESKDLNDMSFEDWRLNVFRRVKAMYLISKTLQDDITANGRSGKAFVVSATDMGGTFGVDDFTSNNPIGGGVAGLTKGLNKEFNREKKEVRVKHIDFSLKEKPAAIAKTILNEIQLGGDRVEVGYTDKKRFVPQVIYKDIDMDTKPRDIFAKGSVFVITGGGYGITSAIAKDLARNLKPKLAIISLEPLQSNIADLAKLDENGLMKLKDKVVGELKAHNERVTPVMIDKEFRKYTIAIEIYNNLKEMKELGAVDVEYFDCNVMDNKAMTAVMQKIRDKFGPIDAIIHGAGIEQSKLMADKSFEDFCRVVDVKADGCFNLMEFAKKDKVKALVTFASISGRFGNIGQTDYSAANDLLNKYVQHSNRRFAPHMKGVSLNWSGWMGVGMATRGSITQIFEEAKIDMIPMEEGVTKVREELLYGNDAEVLVAGNVGYIDIDGLIVGEKTKEFKQLADLVKSERGRYPLIDEIIGYKPGRKIIARKKLDTETDLYLKDHAIADVPYLPAVMGIETFAEISTLLFRNKKIKLMKDIKFNIPIKILKGKPVELIVTAEKVASDGDEITVKTRIETEFFNKDGIKLGDNKLHFEATVVLSDKGVDKKTLKAGKLKMEILDKYRKDGKKVISEKEIYKRFFHGPKYQVHGGVIEIGDSMIYGVISQKNGRDGSHFSFVKKANYLTDPMAIEAAFQNAGLYAMTKKNLMSLPDGISELAFTNIPEDAELLFVRARHVGSDDMKHEYDTEVIDSKGNTYSVMKGYKMVTTGELKEDEKF